MKFKQLQERAPAFTQIVMTGDAVTALDQQGRVWSYIPASFQQGVEGWLMLNRATVEIDNA